MAKFNLSQFQKENPDLRDGTLDDAAKHIYEKVVPAGSNSGATFAKSGHFSDYNDFLEKTGLRADVDAERNKKNAPDRSYIGGSQVDVGVGLLRGAAGVYSGGARAVAGGIEGVRDWLKAGPDGGPLQAAGNEIEKYTSGLVDALTRESKAAERAVDRNLPLSKQVHDNPDSIRSMSSRAVENFTRSIAPQAAGAVAGRYGRVIGAVYSTAAIGLEQYSRAKEEALQNGLSDDDARIHATKQALWESGTEAVSDILGMFAGGSGAVTGVGRKALQDGIGGLFRTTIAQRGKDTLRIAAVEGISELLNAYGQTEASNASGMGTINPNTGKLYTGLDAVRDQAGDIGATSLLFGLFGAHMNYRQRSEIKKTLTDPNVDVDTKIALADSIGAEMDKMDSRLKLDSLYGTHEGTSGTEFAFSVRRQLETTGTVSLTNDLDAVEQIKSEIRDQEFAELDAMSEGHSREDDLAAVMAEPSINDASPFDGGPGVPVIPPATASQTPGMTSLTVLQIPGDVPPTTPQTPGAAPSTVPQAPGAAPSTVPQTPGAAPSKAPQIPGVIPPTETPGAAPSKAPQIPGVIPPTEPPAPPAPPAAPSAALRTQEESLASAELEDANRQLLGNESWDDAPQPQLPGPTQTESKPAEPLPSTHLGHDDLSSVEDDLAGVERESFGGEYDDVSEPQAPAPEAKPTPSVEPSPSSPTVIAHDSHEDLAGLEDELAGVERHLSNGGSVDDVDAARREARSNPEQDVAMSKLTDGTNAPDADTHPTVESLAQRFINRFKGSNAHDIGKLIGEYSNDPSANRDNLAGAAFAALDRAKTLREERAAAHKSGKKSLVKLHTQEINALEHLHASAMAKLDLADGSVKISKTINTVSKPIPKKKMHPSTGDDQNIVRNGVVRAVTRFLQGHGLRAVFSNGKVRYSRPSKGMLTREELRKIAERLYDEGYVYDTHSINPNANYASGAVGGIPGASKLLWRTSDNVARHAKGIDFTKTRVGARHQYNRAVLSGDAKSVAEAEEALRKHYADRKASGRESRPVEVDGNSDVWGDNRISADGAREIFRRATKAASSGKFPGRIRLFTDKSGNRILRHVHNLNSPDKFEDYLVDPNIESSPEDAKRFADHVANGKSVRDLLPRRSATEAVVNETVEKLTEHLMKSKTFDAFRQLKNMKEEPDRFGKKIKSILDKTNLAKGEEKSGGVGTAASVVNNLIDQLRAKGDEKSMQRVMLIENNREAFTASVRKALRQEQKEVRAARNAVADMSSAEAVTESKIDEPYSVDGDKSLSDDNSISSARSGIRSARSTTNSDANEEARSLFNMTTGEQQRWLVERLGLVDHLGKPVSPQQVGHSAEVVHEEMLTQIEEKIKDLRTQAANAKERSTQADTDEAKLEAKLESDSLRNEVSYLAAMHREYSRMIDEQATRDGEGSYEEEIDGVSHHLDDTGYRSQPRAGHVSYDDAVSLLKSHGAAGDNGLTSSGEKATAFPVFKGGRLVAVRTIDKRGRFTMHPIDRNTDRFVHTKNKNGVVTVGSASSAAANGGTVGNYDMNEAVARTNELMDALGLTPDERSRVAFCTAEEADAILAGRADSTGMDLSGSMGFYDPVTDMSYVITDNVSSVEEFVSTALHEVGAHGGLARLLPDYADRGKLLEQLFTNRMVVDIFMDSGHGSASLLSTHQNLSDDFATGVSEEALAIVLETVLRVKNGRIVFANGRPINSVVVRILAIIRGAINKIAASMGFKLGMSNSQVYSLIANIIARRGPITAMQRLAVYSNGTVYRNVANWNTSAGNRLIVKYADYAHPIDVLQQSIENMGNTILADQDVYSAITDAPNTIAALYKRFVEKFTKPLIKMLEANKVDLKKFDAFLTARHALERNRFHSSKIKDASGMSDADAMSVIDGLVAEGLVSYTVNQAGQLDYAGLYGTIGSKVEEIANLRLEVLYRGNLITKAERDNVRRAYRYYIPMNEVEDLPSVIPGIGGNALEAGPILNKVTGRDSASGYALAQVFHQMHASIRAVEMNKVAQHLDRLFAANPNQRLFVRLPIGTDLSKVSPLVRPNIIEVRYRGVARLIVVKNDDILRAIKGGTPKSCGRVLNALRKYNALAVKMNVVYNLPFIPVNMFKDTLTAYGSLFSRDEIGGVSAPTIVKSFFKFYFKAMRFAFSRHVASGKYDPDVVIGGTTMKMSQLYREFESSGAKPGTVLMGSIVSVSNDFKKEYELAAAGGIVGSLKRFVRAGTDLIYALSESSESTTRFASFLAMRQLGIDKVIAGRESKELTVNFARRGDATSVLNALYLFANAGIQGTNLMRRLMFKRDGSINMKFLRVAGSAALLGALASAAARAMGDDDEGVPLYDKLSDHQRSNNLVLPGAKGVFPMIPLPYGFGLFASIGRIICDLAMKEPYTGMKYSTQDAAGDIVSSFLYNFNPIGGDTTADVRGVLHALTPQAGKLFLELYDNSNYYGAPIRPEDSKGLADHLNHKKSTTAPSKFVSNNLARVGIETSPDNIDHTVSSLTGGAGKFVMQLIAMLSTGSETSINDVPVARRYFGSLPDYIDTRSFNSNVADIEAARGEYERIKLDPLHAADVKRFEGENRPELRASNALAGYKDRLHKLYAKRKSAKSPAFVADCNKQIRRLHRSFNSYYYSLRKNQE